MESGSVRGGDVVHGIPLDAEDRGPAAPGIRNEGTGQPDAVRDVGRGVVEKGFNGRLQAVVEPAAVRRRADRRVEVRGAETDGGADPVGGEEGVSRPGEREGRYGRLGHGDPVLLQLHPDVLHVRRDERGDGGEEHLDGAGREEVPVVLRVDPQGEPVLRNGDVAEADVREGEGDPVPERGAGRLDGFLVRFVPDRDQRAADVEGDRGADADLASPLPARVDFQPFERPDAGADIERGADGGREIFRLRRVGRLAFVADRAVLREQREPRGRGVLDAAEREGVARPLARVGEQLDLEPFPLRGELPLAEAAVAEADRDVDVQREDPLGRDDRLGGVDARAVRIGDGDRDGGDVLPLPEQQDLGIHRLVLGTAAGFRCDAECLVNPPVHLEPVEQADGAEIVPVRMDLRGADAIPVFRYHPRGGRFEEAGHAEVVRTVNGS